MASVPATRSDAPDSELDPQIAARLKRDPAGLIAAVVQQHDTGQVLMVGWMDDQALHRTLTTGRATYWSRSRRQYWVKGETSGHLQRVVSVALDCDGDALLIRVDQRGPACHTGTASCFDAGGLLTADDRPAAGEPAGDERLVDERLVDERLVDGRLVDERAAR